LKAAIEDGEGTAGSFLIGKTSASLSSLEINMATWTSKNHLLNEFTAMLSVF